jgi:hypothetical protein
MEFIDKEQAYNNESNEMPRTTHFFLAELFQKFQI